MRVVQYADGKIKNEALKGRPRPSVALAENVCKRYLL